MLCKPIQTKIAVNDALTADEARHARECPDCAAYAAFDADLGGRLAGWRDPLALPRRTRAARPLRLAAAGLGLATMLTLGVLALPTRSTAQTAYARMLARTRVVDSVHLVVRWRPGAGRVADGPMRGVYELWWRPGAWREAGEGRSPTLKRQESSGLMFYRLDPATGEVRAFHEAAAQPDYRSFDLATFAKAYMDPPARFEQPSRTRIVATNAGDWSRMVFTLDPTTELPTHAEKQSRDAKGDWTAAGELDLEFDGEIPDARFTPEDLAKG